MTDLYEKLGIPHMPEEFYKLEYEKKNRILIDNQLDFIQKQSRFINKQQQFIEEQKKEIEEERLYRQKMLDDCKQTSKYSRTSIIISIIAIIISTALAILQFIFN